MWGKQKPTRKVIPQKMREKVYAKYRGHCAYCGCELSFKDMVVDHIDPVINGGQNELNNLNPSCRLCNEYKRDTDVVNFKTWLLDGVLKRLQKLYLIRVAIKYHMLEIKDWDHKFYFEKCEHYCGECKKCNSITITKITGEKSTSYECRRDFEEPKEVTPLNEACDEFEQ